MEGLMAKSKSFMENMTKTIGDNQDRIGFLESLNKQLEGTVQVKHQQTEEVRSFVSFPPSGFPYFFSLLTSFHWAMTLLLIGFATRFLFACMLCYLPSFCHYSCLLPCLFFLACQCLISGFLISHQSPEMPSCKTFPTHLHFTFLSGFKYISLYSLILILTITGLPERGGGLNIQTGKLSEQGFYQRSVIENLKRAKKNVFFLFPF